MRNRVDEPLVETEQRADLPVVGEEPLDHARRVAELLAVVITHHGRDCGQGQRPFRNCGFRDLSQAVC